MQIYYGYDKAGNALDKQRAEPSTDVIASPNLLVESQGKRFKYDKKGRLVGKYAIRTGGDLVLYQSFEWDHRDRLVRIEGHNPNGDVQEIVTLEYDGLNRLIRRSYENLADPTKVQPTTTFVYDGLKLVAELRENNGKQVIRRSYFNDASGRVLVGRSRSARRLDFTTPQIWCSWCDSRRG